MQDFLLLCQLSRLLQDKQTDNRCNCLLEMVHISIRPLVLAEVVDCIAVHDDQIMSSIFDYLRNILHIGKYTHYFSLNYKTDIQ